MAKYIWNILWVKQCKLASTVTALCTRDFACTNVRAKPFYVHKNQCTQILNFSSPVWYLFINNRKNKKQNQRWKSWKKISMYKSSSSSSSSLLLLLKHEWNKNNNVSIQHINLYELSEATASIIKCTSIQILNCLQKLINKSAKFTNNVSNSNKWKLSIFYKGHHQTKVETIPGSKYSY